MDTATTPTPVCLTAAKCEQVISRELSRTVAYYIKISGVPRNFFRVEGGSGSTNSVEDRGQRERGSGGGSPLVRGSGGSCSLVQEISFHIVKFY